MNSHRVTHSIRATLPQALHRPIFLCLVVLLGLCTPLANAQISGFTITFDAGDPINGLPAGSILSTQYAALLGVTFTPNALTGSGSPSGT